MRFVKLHKKDGGEFVISEQLLETCLIVQSDGYTEVSTPHLVYRKGCVPVRETPAEILAMIGGEKLGVTAKATLRGALWDEIRNYAHYAKACDDNGRADSRSIINQIIDQLEHDHA